MATPLQIAAALEAISSGIARAKSPSASKVAADLKCVIAALEGDSEASSRVARIATAHQANAEKTTTGPTLPAPIPGRAEIAAYLDAMADGIDKAANPSASKVAGDLKCLLAALDGTLDARNRVARVAAARKG